VIYVDWNDAQRYVSWLSKITGKTYRLLSQAEYEYATRAGTQTVYPWGDEIGSRNANCRGCGGAWDDKRPAPVGSFAPNRFGLYDMVGNVWEWLEDCYHSPHSTYEDAPRDGSAWIAGGDCSERIDRGGSWRDHPEDLRSAGRDSYQRNLNLPGSDSHPVTYRNRDLGFRVARTLGR
jgi:formylglycine-generating enzyme required for sulfatase activity